MLPGGFFLLHRVEGEIDGADIQVLEVIGAGTDGRITDRFYDNRGMTGEQVYRLDGRRFAVDGVQQRFHGEFDAGYQRLDGLWEMSEDRGKTWRPWMNIVLEKQSATGAVIEQHTSETRH